MFDLFLVPNFINIGYTEILRPNLPKLVILCQDYQFQLVYSYLACSICSECQILEKSGTLQF